MAAGPGFKPPGQRIVVYPRFLKKLETVLATGKVGLDMEGGHDIAYERILNECNCWRDDCRPIFLAEDSEAIGHGPVLAEKVCEWMNTACQTAAGGYRQVLENGPDKCSLESDSESEDHGEQWSYANIYTPNMLGPDRKPRSGGPQLLSKEHLRAQRAAAAQRTSDSAGPTTQAKMAAGSCEPTIQAPTSSRLPTPLNSDDDSEEMTWDHKRHLAAAKRKSGRAGGLGTVAGLGETDTRATRSRPSRT
jgi:hypothetical protein